MSCAKIISYFFYTLFLLATIQQEIIAQWRCDLRDVRLQITAIDGASIDIGSSTISDANRNGIEVVGTGLEVTGLGCGVISLEVELDYYWIQGISDDAWIHGVSFVPSSGWLSSGAGDLDPGWDYYDSVTGDCSGQTYYDGYFYDECDSLTYGRAQCSCGGYECNPCNSPNDNYGFNCSGNDCPKFKFQLTYCPSGNQTFEEIISFTITNDGNSGSWDDAASCFYVVSYPVRINSSGTSPPDSIVWLSDLPEDITIACSENIPPVDSLRYGAVSGCIQDAYAQAIVSNNIANDGDSMIYTWNVETPCGEKLFHQQSIVLQERQMSILGNDEFCSSDSTLLSIDNPSSNVLWSNGSTNSSITINETNTYSTIVTYDDGCILTDTIDVIAHDIAIPSISGDEIICKNSSTTLSTTNTYTQYLWSNSQTASSINVTNSDTYSLTVTNSYGCTASSSFVVSTQENPQPTIIGQDYFCAGDSTRISINESYSQIAWSSGSSSPEININSAGIYTVNVRDSLGCEGESSININEIALPTPSISGDTQFCIGDSVLLSINNDYDSVIWSNGATHSDIVIKEQGLYSVEVIDSWGCIGTAQQEVTSESRPYIVVDSIYCSGAGLYNVAFESNGTSITNDSELDIEVIEINKFLVSNIDTSQNFSIEATKGICNYIYEATSPDCNCDTEIQMENNVILNCNLSNKTIAPSISNGTANENYLWLDDSGSEISNNPSLEVSNAGIYYFQLESPKCNLYDTLIVVVDTVAPIANIAFSPTNTLTCDITEINLSVDTSPNTSINWSGNIASQSNEITANSAGTYVIQLLNTDNACSAKDSIVILENLELASIIIDTPDTLSCHLDSIVLSAAQSTFIDNSTIEWLDADANKLSDQESAITDSQGWYYFNINHVNENCSAQDSVFVPANYETASFIIKSVYSDSCQLNEQVLSIVSSTDESNKIFNWYNEQNEIVGDAIELIVDSSGEYKASVQNSISGCVSMDSISLTFLNRLSASIESYNTCKDEFNGQILISQTDGAFPPFAYMIDNIPSSDMIDELEADEYLLSIIDNIGCRLDTTILVNSHPAIEMNASQQIFNALIGQTVRPQIMAADQVQIETVQWSPEINVACPDCLISDILVDTSRTYMISAMDSNGCTDSISIRIVTPENTTFYVPNFISPNGDGINDELLVVSNQNILIDEVSIYSRWGDQVYYNQDVNISAGTDNISSIWNANSQGSRAQAGVYVVLISYKDAKGNPQVYVRDLTIVY